MNDAAGLRALPRVDDILSHPAVTGVAGAPRTVARLAAREAVDEARAKAMRGEAVDVALDAVAARAAEILRQKASPSLRRAVNATGIVLHTGLGRAPLSTAAADALAGVAAGFSNVQADVSSGRRGEREEHVEWLFREITGAEAALVVNNNAAATVLVLNTLGAGRDVLVSRGEMVEIGGAFRIPEILQLAGGRLVEVGCTNRTHLRDYEKAITPETGLILSVHQSNYRIVGFTSQVEVADLAKLAHAKGIRCVHDLGSGALVDLRPYGLPYEPHVKESLASGADVTLFSGDKLLGGPQCGIILGKKEWLRAMHKNPFYRTFRVCKLTLAALEATLRLFLDTDTLLREHRLLALLTAPVDGIRQRAEALAAGLNADGWLKAVVCDEVSEIGGGSLAGYTIPTVAVRLITRKLAADEFARQLRRGEPPIFSRVHDGAVMLDMRTVFPQEDSWILKALGEIRKANP